MTSRSMTRRLVAGGAAVAASALVAAGIALGSGTSAADPVSITLNYTCPFPLIGNQPIIVKISSDIPKTIKVGQATPAFDILAVNTIPEAATQGLNLVGAKTLEGKAVSTNTVSAPQFPNGLKVDVPIDVHKTDIPASGAFEIRATGKTPSLTFSQPGQGKIDVGGLKLTMTPKTADGAETGLGTFDSVCTQDPGQNTTLTTFDILPADGTTTTTTSTTSTTPTTTTTTSTTTTTTSTTPTTTTSTTTPPGPGVKISYKLAGAAEIKGITTGQVPLSGRFDADADLAAGKYSGKLTLNNTQMKFKIMGFLDGVSDVAITQVGSATGTLATGALTFDSAIQISLPKVSIFGFPISQTAECKVKSPSVLKLKSEGNFDFLKGGKLVGPLSMDGTVGCGGLNDFISPFVTTTGSPITMNLEKI